MNFDEFCLCRAGHRFVILIVICNVENNAVSKFDFLVYSRTFFANMSTHDSGSINNCFVSKSYKINRNRY